MVSVVMVVRSQRHSLTDPLAWPLTRMGIFILRTAETTGFAKSDRMEWLLRSQEMGLMGSVATAGRPARRTWTSHGVWPWMAQAVYLLVTGTAGRVAM